MINKTEKVNLFELNYRKLGLVITMFGKAIWDKLSECIFENFEILKFLKITWVIYFKIRPNQTCGYWLITPNQQTLCIETIFNCGQLQISERAITK